jgi:methyltransferase family protein
VPLGGGEGRFAERGGALPSNEVSGIPVEAGDPCSALEALRESLNPVERALLAQLYFANGGWAEGLTLARSTGETDGRGLALLEARGRFGLGERSVAIDMLERYVAEFADDTLGLYYLAQLLGQSARPRDAARALVRLIERAADFPGALQGLAALVFPGPNYRELLKRLHDTLRPRVYLEIGVEHGTTLALAVHSERSLGIDPVPRAPARPLPASAELFHMTSDAFFASHRREGLLGARRVDLAFIDGMHWFDYALRDFCNVEGWCGPGSVVVLHDCLPVHKAAATRQRETTFWVGDTWKALECLLKERTDLRISIIPCSPSGLVVIDNPDPASPLHGRVEALIAEYRPLEYAHEPGVLPAHYPVVDNDERSLGPWLAELAGRRILPSGGAP